MNRKPQHSARVLIVDDEPAVCQMVTKIMRTAGWQVIDTVSNGARAVTRLVGGKYDLCILDLRMPFVDGLTVMERVRKAGDRTPIIILTGYGSLDDAVSATKLGALGFLEKPVRPARLRDLAANVLARRRSVAQVRAEQLDAYLAENAATYPLRVDAVCQALGISRRYLSYLCRAHLGTTFTQRLAVHRTSLARHLMSSTSLPLTAVAVQSGFKSYRRLWEAFRRFGDATPGRFRATIAR